MSAAFTPGPWVPDIGTFRAEICSKDKWVASTRPQDARLIAAAPEMYEALKAWGAAQDSGDHRDWEAARRLRYDALAKAEGRS